MFRKNKDTNESNNSEDSVLKRKGAGRETLEALIIAIVLALFIRTFVVQAFKIPSGSMENTLLIGDHLLVNKMAYGVQIPRPAMVKVMGVKLPLVETWTMPLWSSVKKGDVIVFRTKKIETMSPWERDKDYIKRAVAVGGDTIKIRNDVIYINGEELKTPYAVFKGPMNPRSSVIRNFGPYTVPEKKVFVMGDNRDNSWDSRWWGTVDVSEVRGKAFILYFSWDTVTKKIRWDRLLDVIH